MADATAFHELVFMAEGLPPGAARIRSFSMSEGMSRSYVCEIALELDDSAVEPRAWLFGSAELGVVRTSDGTVLRRYGGFVMGLREKATRTSKQVLSVTLESPLAILRLTRDHRIFQNQTTKDIIQALLLERGMDAAKIAWRLSGNYVAREVCTQFGETSFAFVSRLLEEDGIFYFFEHGDAGTVLVFGDASSAYAQKPGGDTLVYRTASGLVSEEAISDIVAFERARPGKVTLRDHDFKRPALDLEASAEQTTPLGREHYDYPGRYVDPGEGARRAKLRLAAMTAASTGARAQGTAFSVTSGHTFTLSGAPDPALDQEWVMTDLETRYQDIGGVVTFESHVVLLPSNVPFYPPMTTPRAVVPGPQIATVTGPASDEIHTDSFGRITVSFPWDRRSTKDDKSSCWVRVGQMHTSGSIAIPRVGWEVLVDFEDGDPDRPVVLGRLYNGLYGPAYSLPAGKTKSSMQSTSSPGGGGSNEIRMEDGAGGEHVHMHSQKDMNVSVANNKTEKVATNANLGVAASHTMTVGASETTSIGAAHELSVGASQTWSVGGSRTKTIGADEKITVGGSRSVMIGGGHTTITPDAFSESTPASFSETVGGSVVEAAAKQISMAVAGTATVSVGAALIAACAEGKSDTTLGAQATTVGGALVAAAAADITLSTKGARATTVGGAYAASAGGDVEISSSASVSIAVGGAVSFNAGSIVFRVGGSNVTISSGAVAIKASEIKLTATGPLPEPAGMVEDN